MDDRACYSLSMDEDAVKSLAAGICTKEIQDAAASMLEGVVPMLPLEPDDAHYLAQHRSKRNHVTQQIQRENAALKAARR